MWLAGSHIRQTLGTEVLSLALQSRKQYIFFSICFIELAFASKPPFRCSVVQRLVFYFFPKRKIGQGNVGPWTTGVRHRFAEPIAFNSRVSMGVDSFCKYLAACISLTETNDWIKLLVERNILKRFLAINTYDEPEQVYDENSFPKIASLTEYDLWFSTKMRCFREAYTGLPVVRVTENQKALNCVVLKYSIPVSEE